MVLGLGNKDKKKEDTQGLAEDEENLDDEPKSILLSLISQLKPGMDLSKVALPTFVLEPRSMLERITDFMSHPELIFGIGPNSTPEERFVAVVRYYLAGWHVRPKGVKKPYNPVLGEIFRCRYDYDGHSAYYVAEQVSHHPPISAWYYVAPQQKLEIYGELHPKSKFLGNSAATIMKGSSHIVFLDNPKDDTYRVEFPNMYARGILFGKMLLELGDSSKVVTEHNKDGYECDVDFKTKGFFSGKYNSIVGKITNAKGSEVASLSGQWSDVIDIQPKGKQKTVFFDATQAKEQSKSVTPLDKQRPNESRRLWNGVTIAIQNKNMENATKEKTAIEDAEREKRHEREQNGESFQPAFFEQRDGLWRAKFTFPMDLDEKQQEEAVVKFIYGDDPQP